MTHRFKALVAGFFIVMAAGSESYAEQIHLTCKSRADAGQVQKAFYTLSRVDGSLSVMPAEANGNVIMDAPPGSWIWVPGPMPKPNRPKTIF